MTSAQTYLPAYPVREHRITAQDGLQLFVVEHGDPRARHTPVLCLPGLTRNSADFENLAARLAPRRRVICPDYRGRGKSNYDPQWRNYHPKTYVDDLRHILAALNLHRVVVIGTSLGGILAMAMSAAMPTHVAGAVLNDIGPEIDASGLARISAYLAAMRDLPPIGDWDAAAKALRKAVPDWPADSDVEWREAAMATFADFGDGRLRPNWDPAILTAIEQRPPAMPDLWPLFRGLATVPVTVVRGERSDILSKDTLAAMQAAMPAMISVTVPGVGHPAGLRTEAELNAIDDLLAAADGPGGSPA